MYYVLSAGTNLGDRLANLTYCREALDLVPGTHVVSASAVYQTQPLGYARQCAKRPKSAHNGQDKGAGQRQHEPLPLHRADGVAPCSMRRPTTSIDSRLALMPTSAATQ